MSSLGSRKLFKLPEDRPALMGILNVTPDSFSDGGKHFSADDAIAKGLAMMEEGADLIDVGGESSRPGAEPVSLEEELRRTIPVVSALAKAGIPVSIDTMKPGVGKEALDVGAFMINDVSGLRNSEMLQLVNTEKPTVCIMHMRGEPQTMQVEPDYADVVGEVRSYLLGKAYELELPKEQIWLDPGFGFGKTVEHNLTLIRNLDQLAETGYPVLIGVSRKGFIGKTLGADSPEDRLEGTLATQVVAQLKGARIIRSHDVKAAKRAIMMTAALIEGWATPSSTSTRLA